VAAQLACLSDQRSIPPSRLASTAGTSASANAKAGTKPVRFRYPSKLPQALILPDSELLATGDPAHRRHALAAQHGGPPGPARHPGRPPVHGHDIRCAEAPPPSAGLPQHASSALRSADCSSPRHVHDVELFVRLRRVCMFRCGCYQGHKPGLRPRSTVSSESHAAACCAHITIAVSYLC